MTHFSSRSDGRTALLLLLALSLLPALLNGCDDQPAAPPAVAEPEGFTFFNLGGSSVLTDDVRDDLEDRLGPYATETRSIIDLEVNYRGFLKQHFPGLHKLNRRLNAPFGERVEHATRKLMFRYARKKKAPFDKVVLIFSGQSQTPLLFSIQMPKEGQETLAALTEKYGPPEDVTWGEEGARTLFWRKGADVLMVTVRSNTFGQPEYHIMIYFADNLAALIQSEQETVRQRQEQIQERGVKAF